MNKKFIQHVNKCIEATKSFGFSMGEYPLIQMNNVQQISNRFCAEYGIALKKKEKNIKVKTIQKFCCNQNFQLYEYLHIFSFAFGNFGLIF